MLAQWTEFERKIVKYEFEEVRVELQKENHFCAVEVDA